jgi:hypothetical protein
MSPTARRLALALICALALAGCELNPGAASPPPGQTKAGDATPQPSDAYPAPATAVPATATAVPVLAPTAVSGALLGSEWTLLYSGDLNGDGKADVVGVKLVQGVAPGDTFRQAGYSSYKGPASEVVIVQAGDGGAPVIQADLTGAVSPGAAALMVSVAPGSTPLVSVWGISQAGAPVNRAVGLVWDSGAGAYVPFAGLAK